MAYESCSSVNASSFGPSLVNICNVTTFLAFISTLESDVEKNNVISGTCSRVKPVEIPDNEYDFIVVGGGAGGAVVASRLSENPEWKVLLMEAGPDEPAGSGIPAFATKYLGTGIEWNYSTTNETNACQSRNGSCPCVMGKNLGGNTAHNELIYLRGNPTDFNNWAALGNEGWTWEEVEEFFIKSEDNGEIERVGTKHHGTGGPLSIERSPYIPAISSSLLDAAEELGYVVSEDLNGDQFTGFAWNQLTIKNGVRNSTASAFLRPARDRENLHISLNSLATKILIDNKKAVGVEYYKDDGLRTVYVNKEVIVSGGVVNSPQILLLSGIGPKEHLESVGVPVILDLPGVGLNLHNHLASILPFTVDEPDTYLNNWDVAAEYVNYQTGPLSAAGSTVVVGVVATDMTEEDYPDMQIYMYGYRLGCAPGEVDALQSNGKRTVSMLASYLHPKSRGSITLASNDPLDYPIIRLAYLENSDDLKAEIKGLRIALTLSEAKSFESYNLTAVPVETCSHHEFLSDDYLACVIQSDNQYIHHFAGSCKMGPDSDSLAVVDPQLKVHGIEGLRVADASIMPKVISANTQATTIMIGERAADFIQKQWSEGTAEN